MNEAMACAKVMVGSDRAWFGKVARMPQPAGRQDAEAFVGRSHELAVLSAALHQAATGDARLALVSGEPGIGKTELARAFARAAAASGALVLWGRASVLLLRFAAAARLSRVLLLATYRTAEAALDPDVSDVIAALESASPPLVLAGLSAGDIRLMLPGAGADVLAVVQRRSE